MMSIQAPTFAITYGRLKRQKTISDARGVAKTYAYDDLGRVRTAVKRGAPVHCDITTSYTYDGEGRGLTETMSAGTPSLQSGNQ